MSGFVGVRIENGEFEVGFRAATRREYEDHQRVVAAAADLFWPPERAEPDLARDPADPPQEGDFPDPATPEAIDRWALKHAAEIEVRKRAERWDWRERQGLLGADDGAVS